MRSSDVSSVVPGFFETAKTVVTSGGFWKTGALALGAIVCGGRAYETYQLSNSEVDKKKAAHLKTVSLVAGAAAIALGLLAAYQGYNAAYVYKPNPYLLTSGSSSDITCQNPGMNKEFQVVRNGCDSGSKKCDLFKVLIKDGNCSYLSTEKSHENCNGFNLCESTKETVVIRPEGTPFERTRHQELARFYHRDDTYWNRIKRWVAKEFGEDKEKWLAEIKYQVSHAARAEVSQKETFHGGVGLQTWLEGFWHARWVPTIEVEAKKVVDAGVFVENWDSIVVDAAKRIAAQTFPRAF